MRHTTKQKKYIYIKSLNRVYQKYKYTTKIIWKGWPWFALTFHVSTNGYWNHNTLSSWSWRGSTDKEPGVSSECEAAWKEAKSPGSFQDPEQSQHQRQCLDDFNLRKMVLIQSLLWGYLFWHRLNLSQITLHLQFKWLINRHKILLLHHNTLKKMDGFYYSTYYFLSAKVLKMWFLPSLPSCKNERGVVIIYCWKEM